MALIFFPKLIFYFFDLGLRDFKLDISSRKSLREGGLSAPFTKGFLDMLNSQI